MIDLVAYYAKRNDKALEDGDKRLAVRYARLEEAERIAREQGGQYDRILCCGGDGTLNEVLTGLVRAGVTVPVGYVPTGTTNDLAHALNLPTRLKAAMNLAADTQTALEQNLSLQSNKRGYANMAEGSADKKNMDRTIKNQEQTIRSSMQTLYNDIMQKQTALQLADASLAAETQTMNAMQKKLELGMATQLEYKSEEVSFLEKQIDKETANMNLQQAIEMYEWALKGYMK